jgi:hypothetical protein
MMKRPFLCLVTPLLGAFSLHAANIAFLSYHAADNTPSAAAAAAGFTTAADIGYTALLAANGHNVTRFQSADGIQNFPDTIDALNTNDLVIISRCVPSGHYQDAAETAVWNGLTPPVMVLGGYVNRAVRLGFHTADTIPDANSTQMFLKVAGTAHPIFAGVALDANKLMVNPYAKRTTYTNTTGATTLQLGISVVTSPLIAGGSVLATVGNAGDAAAGGMIIGEFPAGITSQRGDVLAAKRLVFLTGSRESGVTGEASGLFDLLPDGQTLFLNAVTYLTMPQPPKCAAPLISGTNLLPGDAWTFSPGPIGDPPLTYQWFKNGTPIDGQTGPTLTFASLVAADAGDYTMTVSNTLGSATSTTGTLTFATFAPANLTNGIMAYWPLDTVLGTKTPDLVSGYDMTLVKMGTTNIAAGKWGNALQFDNAAQSILQRVDIAGDALPICQFPDFSVSTWVNGPIQADHRIFAEGSLTNTNPMFDFGTHNGGSDGTVDIFIRSDGGATIGDHRHSTGVALDSTWHHIAYVQRDVGNGNMRAQLWVDGVLDPVLISPVRPITANTTAIGGLLRASASAWFTGLIDEVAVWNRALSPEEIAALQTTYIVNPPSRLQPLAVRRFKADLPAVVAGASTTLRWDVSKDANQVEIAALGDVTAITASGIGSKQVTPTQTTSYVLTVKRGTDTLSSTTTVAVVEGVAPGWALLDNFDQYAAGGLAANGYWNDTVGNSAQVVAVNGNPAARLGTAGIAYLDLRDLAVTENQIRTLFFRVIAGADNASAATNIVGLTDKSQRSFADDYINVGPVLYAAAFTNDVVVIPEPAAMTTNAWFLGARYGYAGDNTSNPIDWPGPALESGAVYNVWVDITNAPMVDLASDLFTVSIQKEGAPTRTVIFQDYISDRDPTFVDSVLGGMLPTLDKLIIIDNTGSYSAFFDDFYISTGGYNATVPRPYGSTSLPPGPIAIRSLAGEVEITWTHGTLQQAASITGTWSDVPGNPAPPYRLAPAGASTFYRARK